MPGSPLDPIPPAYLRISGPDVEPWKHMLTSERATVGRLSDVNDIVLAPDPNRFVSGRSHCELFLDGDPEREWYVVGHGRNGTFLRDSREQELFELPAGHKHRLSDGETICLLARLSDSSPAASYWKLVFHSLATVPRPPVAWLDYDWTGGRVWRIRGTRREEITGVREQVHILLRYLVSASREADGAAVLCSRSELTTEVWGEDPTRTPEQLNGLVLELRRKIEVDPTEPRFVQTVRGRGFRFDPRPQDPPPPDDDPTGG